MRPPSGTLVVDANIILSAALGFRSRHSIAKVGRECGLVVSADAAAEALRVADRLAGDAPHALKDVAEMLSMITVVPDDLYAANVPHAEAILRNAVASRDAGIADAHVLALAWAYDADIWSHDRDFAGTGWPSWSSANLGAALTTSGA